jgi:predicted GNAT superfamily acetyltransferase
MDCRVIETSEEFELAVEVEIAVWRLNPRDCVPSSMFRALTHAGGVAHGAFEGEKMIGVALAFPALRAGRLILWSHMTGVLPEYQRRDIGFSLKHAQREWALAHSFDEIGWTFDPLRRGNANFNLHRLGATARVYHVNFYGEMTDSINAGTPSDRLEVNWRLNDSRVIALTNRQPVSPTYPALNRDNILLADGSFVPEALAAGGEVVYAQVPSSLGESVVDVQAWRLALRVALQQAFARGYETSDFIMADDHHWYVLRQL